MQIHIGKLHKVLKLGAFTENYHQLPQTIQLPRRKERDTNVHFPCGLHRAGKLPPLNTLTGLLTCWSQEFGLRLHRLGYCDLDPNDV